jgi:hypothetical protein
MDYVSSVSATSERGGQGRLLSGVLRFDQERCNFFKSISCFTHREEYILTIVYKLDDSDSIFT